ncbi:MAG: TIM-barrel domain-containing protein [Chryseotalea sp.]
MGHINQTTIHKLQNILQTEPLPQGILATDTEHKKIRIQFISDTAVRITATHKQTFEEFSYTVIQTPKTVSSFNVVSDADLITVSSNSLSITLQKKTGALQFHNQHKQELASTDPLGICWNENQITAYHRLQEGERFIGLGEKTGPLDRKGQGYVNWNTDNFAYHSGADPLYCSTPFYIGVHNGLVYGVFLDNTFKSYFNFGASNNRFSSMMVEGGDLNYYFFSGNSVADIIEQYTALTGRMPLPPLWSIGYQQCRYSYFPDKEVISIADTFREKDIPADVIVLDIHYMDAYKIFTWHKQHFTNPAHLIQELQARGFEVVVMCDPGIKTEAGYEPYEDGLKQNIFIKYPDNEPYTAQVWPGWCHFPDFTKPEARKWWGSKFVDYISLGIKGFWNDMNEIATWGNQLPENLIMDFEGQPDTMRRGRNLYGFQMARATYEGTKALLQNKRPFNLTRAGFSGIQRYSAVWTGDNVASDEHMILGTRMLNSMGLAGIAFCGYDVGGFVGDANPKLFARWIALGAFSPFFRGHSMVNSRDSEPWSFGEEVEEISRNYIKLRYRLLPYLYSAFYQAHKTGLPVNRSLAIAYTFDNQVYTGLYQNQYMFGDALLVAPVESYKDLVKVYLPVSTWYSLYTDTRYQPGENIVECPSDKLPVFVKASSILCMTEGSPSNTKEFGNVLEIHVYKGEENTTFIRYEDDGVSFDYEQGKFATQKIEYLPSQNKIVIHTPTGDYKSVFTSYKVFLHGFGDKKEVRSNQQPHPLQTMNYRFLEPLRSFDPVGHVNEGYKIDSLPYLTIPASHEEITITL